MNTQRNGGRAPNASRQNQSKNYRQTTKSQTNGGSNSNTRNSNNRNRNYKNYNNNNPNNNINTPMVGNRQTNSVAAAYSKAQVTRKPFVSRQSVDSTTLRHRELFANVMGTTTFSTSPLSVNPGLSVPFPWLSIQAQGWEKYRFKYFKVCYVPRCGTNTQGSVMLSVDYDASDSTPSSEFSAAQTYGAIEDAPWKEITLTLDINRIRDARYIRNGPLQANQDVKTYDVGRIYVSSNDAASSGAAWGKVWLEYEVELIIPQLTYITYGSGTINGNASISAPFPFGTAPTYSGFYNPMASGGTMTFNGLTVGVEYLLSIYSIGTVISTYAVTITSGATAITYSAIINSAGTGANAFLTFTAAASQAIFTLPITATTITDTVLVITSIVIPNGF